MACRLLPYDTVVKFFYLYSGIVLRALKPQAASQQQGICAVPQAAFGGADLSGL